MSEQITITPPPSIAPASPDRVRVAAWWHTALFVALIFGLSAAQALQRTNVQGLNLKSRMPFYVATVIFDLILLGYVWLLGLRPAGKRMRDLVGGKWSRPREFFRDVGIAAIFWVIIWAVLGTMAWLMGPHDAGLETVKGLLPQGIAEMIAWVVLAVTAGFVEEVIFRGYLQRQFFALTGKYEFAIVLQALVFGSAHLYQGWKNATVITVYGALFGILAVKAKSLRPGMMQHAGQDTVTGIVGSILRSHKVF